MTPPYSSSFVAHGLCFLLLFVVAVSSDVIGQSLEPPQRVDTAAHTSIRPTLRTGRQSGEMKLDGILGEASWATADSITSLTQVEPFSGRVPSSRTVVRVVTSPDAVMIGIRAEYPEGVAPVSFARQRDAQLSSEDNVRIVLDTYLDGRSGYVFAVNPAGARYDALVASQGENENSNWDAVWEAATSRTATGWSVEIRIPVRSLLFAAGLDEWGFNIERRIQRLQETDRWSSASLDYRFTRTSGAGRLTDMPRFNLGLGLNIRPSVTGGAGVPAPEASVSRNAQLSLDATQRLAANTLASLTINTDFAETEVDARRTNLSRFPLFFPEKRTFFLEGSDIFEFGLGLDEDVRPFFSRRIGLVGGRAIPLNAGTKVIGRLGNTNFGALAVRMGDVDGVVPAATMGVVRIKQNILRESSVGILATAGDPRGIGGSWLGGADFTYQTSRFRADKNFLVGVWGLAMDGDSVPGRKNAAGFKIDYPNDLWNLGFTYKNLGDGFVPALGFVPRPAVQIGSLAIDYRPRPKKPIGPLKVRQMFYELRARAVTAPDGRWESYRVFTAPLNWQLESGDRFEANVLPTGERLPEDFEVADGVVIPKGEYHWNRYRIEAGLAAKRRFAGQLTWWFGDFYDGKLDEFALSTTWRPSPLVILELSGRRSAGRLAAGRFTQDLIGARVRLNVSPDLQFNSFMQYDNESESFGTNTRLRWTFTPLGELFLVYNHNIARRFSMRSSQLDEELSPAWGFSSNQLLVKVQYSFRF